MNQKLQQLLTSIQQSGHLSEDEKNVMVKTVGQLDKEIEIISFKLDRTEKVKRTTAILLEETIEELEQKRKAVEAQNRELEIETALERVRSRTMGMQKSDELKEIIREVYDQFSNLKILIEHAGFIMDYKERDDMNIWLADKHTVPSQIVLPYFDSPHWNSFDEAKEKGLDFFANYLAFEEKNKFYRQLFDFIPGQPEELTEYYFNCAGVAISTVLLENVGLYIENFSAIPYTPEENKILRRFGKVFQQSYTRFHDLQKAEAQAREAQIEAALEKIRSRSLAMHRSVELKEVMAVMSEKMTELNVLLGTIAIQIFDEKNKSCDFWVGNDLQNPALVKLPYDEKIVMEDTYIKECWEARAKGENIINRVDTPEKINHYFDYVFANNDESIIPPPVREFIRQAKHHSYCLIIEKNSSLFTDSWTEQLYSDEQVIVLKRVAKVFDQAYIRFLDLQKAEAQARESQIQLALERVRAKTMAMQHSGELADTAAVLFEQIKELGFETWSCGFCTWEDNDLVKLWMGADSGGLLPPMLIPYKEEPTHLKIYEDSLKSEPVHQAIWEGAALQKHYAFLKTIPSVKEAIDILENSGLSLPERQCYYAGFFEQGYLLLITKEPNPELQYLSKRFAAVFEQTYTRFLDLQKAEEQATEAKIEMSLERVRSKTMAMHNSTDVGETAAVMVDELKKLGIVTIRCGIGIMHEPGDMEVWTIRTNENDKSDIIIGWLDMHIHPLLHGAFESWRNKNESYSYELKNEDLLNYYNAINNYPGYPIRYDTATLPQHIHHNEFYFPEGILFAFSMEQLSAEQRKIFKRFAAVFGQTYRRYLDLKRAEAQAREAKIEAALERVRSRTLAMQNSDELTAAAAVLFRQLIGLGIAPNRLYIGVIKDAAGHMEFWVTDEEGNKVSTQFIADAGRNTSMKKIYDAWKAENKSFTTDMQGKELEDYFHYLAEELKVTFKQGLSQKRRIQSIAFFGKGFIGIASPDEQPAETLSLLERFAAVFNLTYTRFSDLKIAEAHAIQAVEDLIKLQTEKKRAEDALTELQVTQKQLIQSEKMASLGELTAGIAHEIQNPLNFVNNFSEVSSELLDEMMEEVSKENYEEVKLILQDVKQNLEKITHHGKRADGIVKGMLQHSRSSSNQKEPTNINALADEYLRLAYHGLRAKDKSFNATLKTNYDEGLGNVNVIPQDMGRVLLNLITNAFYVVTEKRKSSFGEYDPTVSVTTSKVQDKVAVSVTDNGNGIPKNIIDKIFQPFFTTKPTGQGTGLGLSLAYDIIKAHGGELKVKTKEGEGSVFTIELPNT